MPVQLGTPPFQVEFERELSSSITLALRKFPDAQSCLETDANAALREDLARMDWDRISTSAEAKVCSFRLLHGWGDVSEAESWMKAQGFQISKGINSTTPYMGRDKTLRVDGSWSIREYGPRFPTSGVFRRIVGAIPYGMSIHATYSADGRELLFVSFSSSTA